MDHHVDYDAIAGEYDRRYVHEQHQGVERTIADFVGDDATQRILEVGCGTGHWLEWLSRRGFDDLAGLDASLGMLAVAQAKQTGAELRHGDASDVPWPRGSFDRVLCVNALHHFGDQSAFVREARRVLSGTGALITFGLDPHVGADRWAIYDLFEGALAADRRRYPSAAAIRRWMTAAGFTRAETFVAMHAPGRMPARDALDTGYFDRSRTSQLTILSDDDYARGLARIERQIDAADRRDETFEIVSDLRVYATVGWVRPLSGGRDGRSE